MTDKFICKGCELEHALILDTWMSFSIKHGIDEFITVCRYKIIDGYVHYSGSCSHEYAGKVIKLIDQDYYQRILQPAIDRVIDLFMQNECKYGEGIKLDKQDLLKAAGHAISAERGLTNQDGQSHATAAASRALKGVLAELE